MDPQSPEAPNTYTSAKGMARSANQDEIRRIGKSAMIIDKKINEAFPTWYKKPEPPNLPEHKVIYDENVFMDETFFHITGKDEEGRDNDRYERVVLANARFCFDKQEKPVLHLTDNNNKTAEIQLGDKNKKFMKELSEYQARISRAFSDDSLSGSEQTKKANDANNDRRLAIANNTLVAGIFKEISSGTSLDNVAIRAAGGSIT
jgi:hypothetical protein